METKEAIDNGFERLIEMVNNDFNLIDKTAVTHLQNQLNLTRATLIAQLRNTRDAIHDHMKGPQNEKDRAEVYLNHPVS